MLMAIMESIGSTPGIEVPLPDVNPGAFKILKRYLYTGRGAWLCEIIRDSSVR
jgi:hypothetical protein